MGERPQSTGYRADIDGLRAIAILTVVAFHVGVPGLVGGFIGVDVFFVVSGFLITGLLVDELSTHGRISILNFYARRARRLLPALTVTLLLSTLIGFFVLIPDPELRWFAQSVIAVSFGAANIFFLLKTDGYFDASAETQPLLHTWSLAVEEQFYVFWPLLLWMVARASRHHRRTALLAVTVLLSVVSFGLAVWAVRDYQQATFYLMPTRLWELGLGGLLAISQVRLQRPIWGIAGVLLVGVSVAALDSTVPFPGLSAVPAVVGTALIIASGGDRSSLSRVLSHPWMVAIGRRSYSWYLLHWPALTFARVYSMEDRLWRDLGIAVGTYVLADVSYRYVESPFRRAPVKQPRLSNTPRRAVLAGLGTLAASSAVGVVILTNTEVASQVPMTASERAALTENRTASELCPNAPPDDEAPFDCEFNRGGTKAGSEHAGIVLVGDSHALALLPAIQMIAAQQDMPLAVMWDTGCPVLFDYSPPLGQRQVPEKCRAEDLVRGRALRELAGNADLVIVTGRYSSFLAPGPGLEEAQARMSQSIRQGLSGADAPVLMIQDVPHFQYDVPQCLIRRDDCGISTAEARAVREPQADMLATAAAQSQASVWDPFATLCTDRTCTGVGSDGTVLYRDRTHLSTAGALSIAPALDAAISEAITSVRSAAD